MDLSRIEAWTRDRLEAEARRRGIRNPEFRTRAELVKLLIRDQYGGQLAIGRELVAQGVRSVSQARGILSNVVGAALAALPEPLDALARLRAQLPGAGKPGAGPRWTSVGDTAAPNPFTAQTVVPSGLTVEPPAQAEPTPRVELKPDSQPAPVEQPVPAAPPAPPAWTAPVAPRPPRIERPVTLEPTALSDAKETWRPGPEHEPLRERFDGPPPDPARSSRTSVNPWKEADEPGTVESSSPAPTAEALGAAKARIPQGTFAPSSPPPPPVRTAPSRFSVTSESGTRTFVEEPIRTRSMARLLAAQGHRERALAIYEELLGQNSADGELQAEAQAIRAGTPIAPPLPASSPVTEVRASLPDSGDRLWCEGEPAAGLRLRWHLTEHGQRRARAVLGGDGELAIRVVSIAPDPLRVVRSEITEHGPIDASGEWTAPALSDGVRCFAAVGLRDGDRFVAVVHARPAASAEAGPASS